MTAIGREEAQVQIEGGGVEIRTHEIGGDMTVAFMSAGRYGTWCRCWSDCLTTSASVRTGDMC